MPRSLVSILVVGLLAAPAASLDFELSAEEKALLDQGRVVVTEIPPKDGTGFAFRSAALVDAEPAALWEVMRICHDIDEYMPRMVHAVERDHTENSYVCDTEISLPFPLSNRINSARSVMETLSSGGFRRRWSLVHDEGDYLRNNGSWTIHPWQAKGTRPRLPRSLLVHTMDAKLKTSLPKVVMEFAQNQEAPAAFDAIRARVRARQIDVAAPPPDVSAPPPDVSARH